MINYIKEFIREMSAVAHVGAREIRVLKEELRRLDPRDFEPEAQHQVLRLWVRLEELEHAALPYLGIPAAEFEWAIWILDRYRGAGSRGVSRSFAFVVEPQVRQIIERDYSELQRVLFPGAAWKSAVIMAGSILEAILHDVLANPIRRPKVNASPRVPKDRGKKPIPVETGEWKLAHLIDVAVHVGVLPKARGDSIDQVLRDYRNFVHPKVEVKAAHPCTEAEAMMAKGALDGVCNHLEQTLCA